jgi:hypothetical protein
MMEQLRLAPRHLGSRTDEIFALTINLLQKELRYNYNLLCR